MRSRLGVAMPVDGVAGHEQLGTSTDHLSYRVRSNPTIYLDAIVQPAVGAELGQAPDLVHRTLYKFLAAEARIDGHNQHIIHQIQNFRKHLDRSCRIDNYPRGNPMAANQVQS